MLKVLFHSLTGGFKIPLLFVSLILIDLDECKSTTLYKIQGQEANMIFPYPCNSTKVTLQHSNGLAFYSSTDGSSLSLSQDQLQRFKVKNRHNTDNCSLEFTISDLQSIDVGTYLSTIYQEDGQLRDEYTTRVGLQIGYPPGKASCVVSEGKGGDWVSIDCTADVRSVSGKIECYQNGVWMPPLTDSTETDTLLIQTILIRKSHPVFCCSSTLDECKERCKCNDTGLYITDGDSNDPCPTLEITTMPLLTSTSTSTSTTILSRIHKSGCKVLTTLTENNQSDNYSTVTSSIPINTKHCISTKWVNIHSIAILIEVILLALSLFFHYKMLTKIRNNNNGKDPPIPLESNTSLL